jgi:hypothetical protein
MALQRTPRPRFFKGSFGVGGAVSIQAHAGTGRSLRSLGTPLNAQPLGRIIHQEASRCGEFEDCARHGRQSRPTGFRT